VFSVPVSRVPRLGAMRELITYQCPACGHIETLEKPPNTPPAIGEQWRRCCGDTEPCTWRACLARQFSRGRNRRNIHAL